MAKSTWPWVAYPAVRFGLRPDLTRLLPNLLVGEYPTPDDVAWLRAEHDVTDVVSLQDDADLASKGLEITLLEGAYRTHAVGFHRFPVPDCDTESLAARLPQIVARLCGLHAAGGRVYVHCNAGMNRAPTVAIAYLHVHHGWSLATAQDFVKQRRHCVPYMRVLELCYPITA